MNTVTDSQTDIAALIGLDGLSEGDQQTFLAEIGDVVFDAALLRLVAGLSDGQGLALDHYLEDEPSADVLMKHLVDHYPEFETILQEEMIALREEIVAVMPAVQDGDETDLEKQ